jgi:hypothetical protein
MKKFRTSSFLGIEMICELCKVAAGSTSSPMIPIGHPMKALICLAAILALNPPAQADSLSDPIAPAATGQLQCYSPDTTRKTCSSLASYKPGANGAIDNLAVVLISKDSAVTMETVTQVNIKADQVCGKIRSQDLDAARFKVGGQLLDPNQAVQLREQMRRSYVQIFDREICTAYIHQGGILLAKATIDGAPMPATVDQRVMWVSPDDGYRVGP